MSFSIQPVLADDRIALYPLTPDDFDAVYSAASDPLVWAQHPNKDRWKKDVFRTFFEGALQSGGAFKIVAKETGRIIGSTRFYDYNEAEKTILIGYTFFGRAYWGKGYNRAVKALMLDYIFQFVNKVFLHIGAENKRSQVSISRIGAEKTGEEKVAYFGEAPMLNYVYELSKERWREQSLSAIS